MKNNKHHISNKKIFAVFGIIVLAAIAYGIFYLTTKNKTIDKDSDRGTIDVTLVNEKETKDSRIIDTDGDGVYDWIEELWPELDPHNPDSDGDGVSDGKYIQQRQLIQEKERSVDSVAKTTLTESEKLGRSVYTALLAIQNSGGTFDENTQEQISENIMDYISDLSLGSKIYIRDEVELVSDTKDNSYIYRDKMLALFKKYPVRTSEINLIMQATKEPIRYRDEIEAVSIKYDSYIHDLSGIKVPYIIAGRHTELLNALGQLEGSLKNLSLEDIDDVVSLASLVQMEKTMNTIVETNLKINTYFDIISDPSVFRKEY